MIKDMQCFRLSHAGFVLEEGDMSLIIDPGNFSNDHELSTALTAAAPPAAMVITHEHADHWTPENVRAVRAIAPQAPIFTTIATAVALGENGITTGVETVREGDTHQVGPFSIEFYGKRHEQLHSSIPVIDNVGLRVNSVFAYGGDSLMRPPFFPDVLGIPIGSPWSNLSQVMDFVIDAAPQRAYLTHDGMLSPAGLGLFTQRVSWCLEQRGGTLIAPPRLGDDFSARLHLG